MRNGGSTNGGHGESLERIVRKFLSKWDRAFDRLDHLDRRTDQIMKYLLRREVRDQERWREEKDRWKENQERWKENQGRWKEDQERWKEYQEQRKESDRRWREGQERLEAQHQLILEILSRIPKPPASS